MKPEKDLERARRYLDRQVKSWKTARVGMLVGGVAMLGVGIFTFWWAPKITSSIVEISGLESGPGEFWLELAQAQARRTILAASNVLGGVLLIGFAIARWHGNPVHLLLHSLFNNEKPDQPDRDQD